MLMTTDTGIACGGLVATFSTGLRLSPGPQARGPSTHAWLAVGFLGSGKSWSMTGFSRKSRDHALREARMNTRHIPKQGGRITLIEVVVLGPEEIPSCQ